MRPLRLPVLPSVAAALIATAACQGDAAAAPVTGPFEVIAAGNVTETLTRFDPVTGFSRGTFGPPLGAGPVDVVLDPSQASVWVNVNDGTLRQFDLGTGSELKRLDYSLAALTFGDDGKLYASDWNNRSVLRIDTTTGTSETFVAPAAGGLYGPSGLTFHDDYLYVSSRVTGEVLRYDADTGAFHDTFASSPGNGPQHNTFGPDGNFYVANDACNCVQRFDGDSGSFMDVFVTVSTGLSDGANAAFGPDGNFYLSSWATGVIKFDAQGRYLDTLDMPWGVVGFTFAPSSIAAPVPEAGVAWLWLAAMGIVPIGVARRKVRG